MADKIVSSAVISVGGYDSSQNHLNLDTNFPGMATDLLNYEVGLNGGYRRINGFEYLDEGFPAVTSVGSPAEGKIFGIFIFHSNVGDVIIASRKKVGSSTYAYYQYSSGSGWADLAAPTRNLTDGGHEVLKTRAAQFNFGNKNYVIFVDGVNPACLWDGTTWYNLTAAGAGTLVSPGGNQILSRPSTVTVFKNHIFLGKDSDYPGIICHSAPTNPVDWTVANGAGQIIAGFNVTQIKPFRDYLYVFGMNSIKNVSVAGTDFVLNDVTNNIGCIATDSVLEVAGDLLFLAPDGLRPISGTDKIGDVQIASVSKQIQKYMSDIIERYDLDLMDGIVIRGKSQLRLFIHDPNAPANQGLGLIGGLRTAENNAWEFSRLAGFRTTAATSFYINGVETVLHGDYLGNVYVQETGNSFNGTDILSIYRTPYITLGDAKVRKLLRTVSTYYRLEGSIEMNLSARFDWDDNTVKNPSSYIQTITFGISVYGDGSEYGDGSTYGNAVTNPLIQSDVEGSFHSIQLTYTTSNSNPPHSILGFVLEYDTQARR